MMNLFALLVSSFPAPEMTGHQLHCTYNAATGYVELVGNLENITEKTTIEWQRSKDKSNWVVLYHQTIKKSTSLLTIFYNDRQPQSGLVFYRLTVTDNKKNKTVSDIVSLNIREPENNWVIFPNPVHDLLTIQYKGVTSLKGVINLYLYNTSGSIILRRRYASNQRSIRLPVDNLSTGIYTIEIMVEDERMASLRFVRQ